MSVNFDDDFLRSELFSTKVLKKSRILKKPRQSKRWNAIHKIVTNAPIRNERSVCGIRPG